MMSSRFQTKKPAPATIPTTTSVATIHFFTTPSYWNGAGPGARASLSRQQRGRGDRDALRVAGGRLVRARDGFGGRALGFLDAEALERRHQRLGPRRHRGRIAGGALRQRRVALRDRLE